MGFVFSFAYDAYHRITSLTDKRGFLWQYGYDENGKVLWAKRPLIFNASHLPDFPPSPFSSKVGSVLGWSCNLLPYEVQRYLVTTP